MIAMMKGSCAQEILDGITSHRCPSDTLGQFRRKKDGEIQKFAFRKSAHARLEKFILQPCKMNF